MRVCAIKVVLALWASPTLAIRLSDYKEKERKVNFRTRFFLMLANEFLAFEHSPLFFVDIIIHCSLLRTCRVRVEEKEEFLVYTVLWTLTCHPYLESATALSDYKEKERKVNFRTRFFLMLANEFLAFEHSPLFFVDIIIHCSLLRTCRVRVEKKEEFLVLPHSLIIPPPPPPPPPLPHIRTQLTLFTCGLRLSQLWLTSSLFSFTLHHTPLIAP